MGIAWGLGALIGSLILKCISKRAVFSLTYFFMVIACLLTGPSYFFQLPNDVILVSIGVAATCFFGALPQPVTVAESTEGAAEFIGSKWRKEFKLNEPFLSD